MVSRLIAFAVSMLDPPPTATMASHGPVSRAYATASFIEASVGSTWTRSNTSASIPYSFSCPAIRCGPPVAATPGSVTTRARRAPYWVRS